MWPCGILKRVVYGVPERTATSAPGADLTLEWRDAETAPDPGPGGAHDARETVSGESREHGVQRDCDRPAGH